MLPRCASAHCLQTKTECSWQIARLQNEQHFFVNLLNFDGQKLHFVLFCGELDVDGVGNDVAVEGPTIFLILSLVFVGNDLTLSER